MKIPLKNGYVDLGCLETRGGGYFFEVCIKKGKEISFENSTSLVALVKCLTEVYGLTDSQVFELVHGVEIR